MKRLSIVVFSCLLLAAAWADAAVAGSVFRSEVLGNRANQVVAGEPASGVDWVIREGRVSILPLFGSHFLLALRVKGLIIPVMQGPVCAPFGTDTCFGFNPSEDILARVVCHDEAGDPAVAATTRAVPFSPEGDAFLVDGIELPDPCFAPIVLIGGSVGPPPEFRMPSEWFAISGF